MAWGGASPTSAQDIGLSAEGSAFISLDFQSSDNGFQNRYSGHVTTFDKIRGFIHSDIQAVTKQQKSLSLKGGQLSRFKNLQGEYIKTKKDRNTVWTREDGCVGSCIASLEGTTWREDLKAKEILQFYSKNTSKRAIPIDLYVSRQIAFEGLCSQGLKKFCQTSSEVALVMDQSQVGLVQIVGSAVGVKSDVATFATADFKGALVTSSPEVISAVYRAVGPDLTDGVVNLNGWSVVPVTAFDTQVHVVELDFQGEAGFFEKIISARNLVSEINSDMSDLFKSIAGDISNCRYGTTNTSSFFDCKFHSSDLNLSGSGAWLKMRAMMNPTKKDDLTNVHLHIYFQRKFDKKSVEVTEGFSPVRYGNADEADMARLGVIRVARAFQDLFQGRVEVRRD